MPDLGAFNERLFTMTALPLRYFQGVALWLFKITASLQVGRGAHNFILFVPIIEYS